MNKADWLDFAFNLLGYVLSYFAGRGMGAQMPRKARKTDEVLK